MLVASLPLCKWLNEWMAGAVRVSTLCTYGCILEIFESRYFRGKPNDLPVAADNLDATVAGRDDDGDGGSAAATANVHNTNIELKLNKEEAQKIKNRVNKIDSKKTATETTQMANLIDGVFLPSIVSLTFKNWDENGIMEILCQNGTVQKNFQMKKGLVSKVQIIPCKKDESTSNPKQKAVSE